MKITARTRAPACALAEIGRCCAPCTGDVAPSAYAETAGHARAALTDGSGPAAARLLELMLALSADGRYREAGWRRDRLAALVDAARRQRTSQALDGVHVAAYRPVDTAMVDLVVIRDGRFHASARCRRVEAERRARELAGSVAHADDGPFLIATERAMLARWLSAADVVLLSVTGRYAEPVDGGQMLDRIATQLRRQRATGRPADELTSKRLRRQQAATPAS